MNLRRILDNSHVLTERLAHHPEWAERLQCDPYCDGMKPRAILERECSDWCSAAGDLQRGLRWCKYYEFARMAWREWNTRSDVIDLLHDWSTVAETLLAYAYDRLTEDHPSLSSCALLALGKLGAEELNISSDVDLVVIHDPAQNDLNAIAAGIRAFTTTLQQPTVDGFVFRVDWDLRPEGAAGPLAISLPAALHYYETRGSDWERLALIRARPIAGQLALGHELRHALQPFIYPRHTSVAIIDALRELKQQIERAHATIPFHVKLGRGGIREIEFIVHAVQLLHGGKIPALQTHSTWDTLRRIADHQLLPQGQVDALGAAYRFLRRVENALQFDRDQQRHSVPHTADQLALLARKIFPDDNESTEHFTHTLEMHRTQVHEAFRRLFVIPYEKIQWIEAVESNLQSSTTLEEEIDALSWSKRTAIQTILADDIGGIRNFDQTSRRVSLLADVIVDKTWRIALPLVHERFGVPLTEHGEPIPFAIIALGNCGALAMDYGSDLDLVFLYGDVGKTTGPKVISAAEFFVRVGQKIIALLNVRHRYGPLYAVDLQLRPSGEFGVLVTTTEVFQRYHREESVLWERQALLRARPMAGDSAFMDHLAPLLATTPFHAPYQPKQDRQIAELRLRMEHERAHESTQYLDLKFGPGGIADVEFLIQALQLKHGHQFRALRGTNPWDMLSACAASHLLDRATAEGLNRAYTLLRRTLAHYRLLTNAKTTRIDIESKIFGDMVEALNIAPNTSAAINEIHDRRQWIRNEFQRYFRFPG